MSTGITIFENFIWRWSSLKTRITKQIKIEKWQ